MPRRRAEPLHRCRAVDWGGRDRGFRAGLIGEPAVRSRTGHLLRNDGCSTVGGDGTGTDARAAEQWPPACTG